MDNMVKREQRSFVPLPLKMTGGFESSPCIFVLLPWYYSFIHFEGKGREWTKEEDLWNEQTLWSVKPVALSARPKEAQAHQWRAEMGFLLVPALPGSPMLFDLGSVH